MKRKHGQVWWFIWDWWFWCKKHHHPIRAIQDAIGTGKWRNFMYDD